MVQKRLAPDNFSNFLNRFFFKFFTHIMVDLVREPETGDEVIKSDLLGISFVFGSVDSNVSHKVICNR